VREAVILDYGHTIVDFSLSGRALLEAYGEVRQILVGFASTEAPSAEALLERVSRSLARRIDESYGRMELEELDIIQEFSACFADINIDLPNELVRKVVELEHRALTSEVYLPPDNAAALQALRDAGFKLGLVSNMTMLGELMREDLDRLGILDMFDSIVISSELGVRKPHPRIYQASVEGLSLHGNQAIFVGDRLREDIAGPQAAGMLGILTHQFRQDERVEDSPIPDALILTLSELPEAAARLRSS